jgi:hypothetical protein
MVPIARGKRSETRELEMHPVIVALAAGPDRALVIDKRPERIERRIIERRLRATHLELVVLGIVTIAAAGNVAAAIPTTGLTAVAAEPDPIFAVIAEHRRTHAAHMESLVLQNRLERKHSSDCGWVSEKSCHDENDAFEALVATPAITLAGLIAWLDFQELSSEFETEWMIEERAAAAVLIQSFVASLMNIGVRP